MDKTSRNFLGMVRATNKVFAERPAVVILPPALLGLVASLGTLYGQARAQARRTRRSDGGLAADKEAKLTSAVEAVQLALGALLSLGASRQDQTLIAFADRSISDLARIPDNEIIGVLEEAIEKVREHLTDLEPYEVTANELEQAEDRIDTADAAIGNPRGSIVDRGAAVEQLGILISQIRALLEQQIDPLIARLAASEDPARAAFAQTYDRARRIVHVGNNVGSDDEDDDGAEPSAPAASLPA